jgi:hypothetical protein
MPLTGVKNVVLVSATSIPLCDLLRGKSVAPRSLSITNHRNEDHERASTGLS